MSINPPNPSANAQPTFDDEFNTLNLWTGASGVWDTNYWYNATNGDGDGETAPNGALSLQAQPSPAAIKPDVHTYQHISGEPNAHNGFSQTYGPYEARASLPAGLGFWPGAHADTPADTDDAAKVAVNATSGWHAYAVDWAPDYTTFHLDGEQLRQAKTPPDASQGRYLTLNLAIGGPDAGSSGPTGKAGFTASHGSHGDSHAQAQIENGDGAVVSGEAAAPGHDWTFHM